MITTDAAINKVYSILVDADLSVPIYKIVKPSKQKDSEYIVINALPISAGVLQKCYVNVNYHHKDLAPGIPDMSTLETMTASLMSLLESFGEKGTIIDFESQEYHTESQLSEHYSNIRLAVKIINS